MPTCYEQKRNAGLKIIIEFCLCHQEMRHFCVEFKLENMKLKSDHISMNNELVKASEQL